jgi:hypothetical protein
MELIPLIITILQVLAALTVLAIIFSFISYKIKLKSGKENESVKKLAQPALNAERRVKQIVQKITKTFSTLPPKEKSEKHNYSSKKVMRNNAIKSHDVKPTPKFERVQIQKVFFNDEKLNSDEDNLNKNKKGINSDEKKNLESLGDEIFDKYAEDEAKELYRLKTKKKNSE